MPYADKFALHKGHALTCAKTRLFHNQAMLNKLFSLPVNPHGAVSILKIRYLFSVIRQHQRACPALRGRIRFLGAFFVFLCLMLHKAVTTPHLQSSGFFRNMISLRGKSYSIYINHPESNPRIGLYSDSVGNQEKRRF